jgi:hypothetical protein
MLLAFFVAWLVASFVRRRYRVPARIVVLAPILTAGLLALLLELDLFLPRFR